jgi:plasmid rolling circle replication initiator protein Rep
MSVIIQSYEEKDNDFLAAEQAEKWASGKRASGIIAEILATCPTLHRKSQRMQAYANTLLLTENMDSNTGEVRQHLHSNRLCHDRNCPICQWRRSKQQRAAFHHAIPGILERHPNIGLIVLTLTIKNCSVVL